MAVQNHIHLATTLGSAPENAPVYRWKTRDRSRGSIVRFELSETLEGNIYEHVVGNDTPVQRFDYQYEVHITGDDSHDEEYYEDLLLSLHGRRCYLVDHRHSADGTDHTSRLIPVIVEVGVVPTSVPDLSFTWIPITCHDLRNP